LNQAIPIVPLIEEVVDAMVVNDPSADVPTNFNIRFDAGRDVQIIDGLLVLDSSKINKNTKYPLVALFTPIKVRKVDNSKFQVNIKLITIAAYSQQNIAVIDRYRAGSTFLDVLYPCYLEFLNQLSLHEDVTVMDADNFEHTLEEDPGVQVIPTTNDFIDCINIHDLQFYINTSKICQ
jgi:hypothetical protein